MSGGSTEADDTAISEMRRTPPQTKGERIGFDSEYGLIVLCMTFFKLYFSQSTLLIRFVLHILNACIFNPDYIYVTQPSAIYD